jgi:hypothetical protein
LPIEFARISKDKRLTLVIHPDAQEVQTYWALSAYDDVSEACENLCQREGTEPRHIGYISRLSPIPSTAGARSTIHKWLSGIEGIDAAVWTALETNWMKKRDADFSLDDAERYLCGLSTKKEERDAYLKASEYIRNAPPQVRTALRARLEEHDNFRMSPIAPILFE